MKIYSEKSLSDFEFWSGAKERVEYLNERDFEIPESHLEELYPDGMDETTINDLFWFEEDFIAECLGYADFDEPMEYRTEDEDDDN